MDFNKAMRYMFEDPRVWTKLLLGAVFNLIPILNWGATQGYMIETLNNVAGNVEPPLPEWSDIGAKWMRGIYLFIVRVIYTIPVVLVGCCLWVAVIALGGGLAALSGNTDQGGQQAAGGLVALLPILALCVSCLILLYSIFLWIMEPAIVIQVARTGKVGAAFRFSEMFQMISGNTSGYAMAVILPILPVIVVVVVFGCIGFVLGIIPIIGLILSICLDLIAVLFGVAFSFWLDLFRAHLYGQFIRLAPQPALG
ncbi:MAG: DUF4013 domain-containing protein [Chloroflexota bacterium]|nr:DUF4013 domain-containing protein [Chloroflexota bacterium]